jgi:drug/metabolite transporter (DMT)-like permease
MIARTLANLPASFASVALLLNPVSATVWAWIILSEPAGWQQIIGGAIVLTGIVLARSDRPDAAATNARAPTDKPA